MQTLLAALAGLIRDPNFWTLILSTIFGVAFVNKGVASQLLQALLDGILGLLQKSLPAQQYQVAAKLAEDAVTYAWKAGNGLSWDNAARKDAAVDQLDRLLHAHGINRFDKATIGGIIETVWARVKPLVLTQDYVTQAVTPAPAIVPTPALPTQVGAPAAYNTNESGVVSVTLPAGSLASVTATAPATLVTSQTVAE